MTDLRSTIRLTTLIASAAIVIAACGSSASTASPPAGSEAPAPPSVEAPASTAPSAAASEAPSAPDLAIPSFDLSALTGSIPGADSYRASFSVGGVQQYQSVVVTKPELSKAITLFDSGTVGTRIIVIGSSAWMATGADGKFESVPATLATSMLVAFDPTALIGAYAHLDLASSAINVGTEQKNGVNARHLRIDSTTAVGAAAQMPAGSAIDLWVADQGYVVAFETTGLASGADVAIEITGVNDPANKVEAPG
jgi:hypothetical protein